MSKPAILQKFLDNHAKNSKNNGFYNRYSMIREWRSYWKQHTLLKAVGTKMNIKVITGFQGITLVSDDPANPETKDFGVIGELWVTVDGSYTTDHMFFYLDLDSNIMWNEYGDEIVAENKEKMVAEIKSRINKKASK